jgi:uncharacterized membrane protein
MEEWFTGIIAARESGTVASNKIKCEKYSFGLIMYILVIIIILSVIIGRIVFNAMGSREWQRKKSVDEPVLKDENYHFGFYYNSNDSRNFVPKRYGGGYTVNLGRPAVALVVILLGGLLVSLFV